MENVQNLNIFNDKLKIAPLNTFSAVSEIILITYTVQKKI